MNVVITRTVHLHLEPCPLTHCTAFGCEDPATRKVSIVGQPWRGDAVCNRMAHLELLARQMEAYNLVHRGQP